MPKVLYECPAVTDAVTRPVVLEIMRQVLEWTGLPRDMTIQFPGETGRVYQNGSTVAVQSQFNRFGTDSRIHMDVTEEHQQDRILSTAVFHDENPHIFKDTDTRAYMKFTYVPTDIVLNITLRSTDKSAAERWRNEIRSRVSMNRSERVHDISYSAIIPNECMKILEMVHELRENVDPYGEELTDYLTRYFDPRARILSNLIGEHQYWAIAERQGRVLGWFEFDYEPEEGQKQQDSSAWDMTFSYRVRYDKPVGVVMDYPLMIHNQMIPEEYRPLQPPNTDASPAEKLEDTMQNFSISSGSLFFFESYRQSEKHGVPGIAIPEFDEFMPARGSVMPDTLRVFTVLSNIDPENPLDLLDLNVLGDVSIDPDIVNYLKEEAPYLKKRGYSFVNVSVYRNEYMMHTDDFDVTEELMVRFKRSQSLRDVYHVRFAIFTRPRLLPREARERMQNHCIATKKLMVALEPRLGSIADLPVCLPGDFFGKPDMDKVLGIIDVKHDPSFNGQLYQFNTVMSLSVQAGKRLD